MKTLFAIIFGGTVSLVLILIAGMEPFSGEWWSSFLIIGIVGVIYANIPNPK